MRNTQKNKNNQNIEEEINLTMQSIEGMQRAQTNPFFYEKVMAKINDNSALPQTNWNPIINIKYAVVIALFVVLNIFTIAEFSGEKTVSKKTSGTEKPTTAKENFTKEYFESSSNTYGY